MKKIFSIIAAAIFSIVTVSAHNVDMLKISDLHIERSDSSIHIVMTLNAAHLKLGSNAELKITPVIYSSIDSALHNYSFPSVIVAGRNRYYANLRSGNASLHTIDGVPFYRCGDNTPVKYSARVPYEPWMEQSGVDIYSAITGCCGASLAGSGIDPEIPVAMLDFRTRSFMPEFVNEAPVYSGPKDRELEGRAYVNFRVNKTYIDPYYMSNPRELRTILETIEVVHRDPDAEVTNIWIKGFASPEGPYDNNVRLSRGRTEALKEYVRKESGFAASLFSTDYEPEDWAGLREWAADSLITNKAQILAIIDSNLEPDAKNTKIQQEYPQEYAYMLATVYPHLRHSDYKVKYRVREFDDVEQIRNLVKTAPGKLSLREFYVAATSYEPGTDDYDNVFETAVRMYPNDPVANINAANAVMSRGDYIRAAQYLDKAGTSPHAEYARGVLAALQCDYDAARALFQRALDGGIQQAEAAIAQLDSMAARLDDVTYK